jgi:hypothetical protein
MRLCHHEQERAERPNEPPVPHTAATRSDLSSALPRGSARGRRFWGPECPIGGCSLV